MLPRPVLLLLRKFIRETVSYESNVTWRGQLLLQSLRSHIALNSIKQFQDAGFKNTSQFNEDGLLSFLCLMLELDKPKIIEIGVGDFTECCSRFLVDQFDAKLVAIDSDKNLISNLKYLGYNSVNGVNTFVSLENISTLWADAIEKLNGLPEILIVDIDGIDYWCVKSLSLSQVSVVVVEVNAHFGLSESLTVPYQDNFDRYRYHKSTNIYGASYKAWLELFKERDFFLVGTNSYGNNLFFVNKRFRSKFTHSLVESSSKVEKRLRQLYDEQTFRVDVNMRDFVQRV